MTTTKTYRVSDGYGVKTFIDRDEAIAYAMDVFKGFRADGMTRVEAAKAIEVKTTVVEVEDMAEFMGGKTFMSELERSDAEEAAESEAPKVEGLSEAMQEAYDGMLRYYRKAVEAKSFEAWYAGSEEAYAEKRAKRVERLGERSFELFEKDARKRYEMALEGIVGANAPMGTVKALERRGLVKYDGLRRVKLLTV